MKKLFNLPITYKDVRHSLTPEGKKSADMAFITYFIKEHDRDAQNAPRSARLHFRYLYLCYYPEIRHINNHIGTKEADNYMLRWGYMLDIDENFTKLIHGTDGDTALNAIENLT